MEKTIDGRKAVSIKETEIGNIYVYRRNKIDYFAAECLDGSTVVRIENLQEAQKELLLNSGEDMPRLRYFSWGDENPGFVTIWTWFEDVGTMSFGQMEKSLLPKDAEYDCPYA